MNTKGIIDISTAIASGNKIINQGGIITYLKILLSGQNVETIPLPTTEEELYLYKLCIDGSTQIKLQILNEIKNMIPSLIPQNNNKSLPFELGGCDIIEYDADFNDLNTLFSYTIDNWCQIKGLTNYEIGYTISDSYEYAGIEILKKFVNHIQEKGLNVKGFKLHYSFELGISENYNFINDLLNAHFEYLKKIGVEWIALTNESPENTSKEENKNNYLLLNQLIKDNGFKAISSFMGIEEVSTANDDVINSLDLIGINDYPGICWDSDKSIDFITELIKEYSELIKCDLGKNIIVTEVGTLSNEYVYSSPAGSWQSPTKDKNCAIKVANYYISYLNFIKKYKNNVSEVYFWFAIQYPETIEYINKWMDGELI